MATPTKTMTSESNGGGGSSPVVPILIAVVLLAAASIGVVLYRERKRGDGPEAPPSQARRQA
jgi:flagellar basal body-associated protein FliL